MGRADAVSCSQMNLVGLVPIEGDFFRACLTQLFTCCRHVYAWTDWVQAHIVTCSCARVHRHTYTCMYTHVQYMYTYVRIFTPFHYYLHSHFHLPSHFKQEELSKLLSQQLEQKESQWKERECTHRQVRELWFFLWLDCAMVSTHANHWQAWRDNMHTATAWLDGLLCVMNLVKMRLVVIMSSWWDSTYVRMYALQSLNHYQHESNNVLWWEVSLRDTMYFLYVHT